MPAWAPFRTAWAHDEGASDISVPRIMSLFGETAVTFICVFIRAVA